MATPRKFSEKIALHTQKQAEETAAFEQIMKEVGYATRGGDQTPYQQFPRLAMHKIQGYGHHSPAGDTLRPPGQRYGSQPVQGNNGALYGGSLPNVSPLELAPGRPRESLQAHIDLQGALNTLNDMKHGRPKGEPRSRGTSLSKGSRARSSHNESRKAPPRVDCSPYASPYLSPPSPEAHWRRTNSDSALHQSSSIDGDAQGSNHGASLSPSPPALHSNSLKIPSPMHHASHNPKNGDCLYNITPEGSESRNGWPSKITHGCLVRRRKDRSYPPPRYNSTGCMFRHLGAAQPYKNDGDLAPLAQFKTSPVVIANKGKQTNSPHHHHLAASSSSSDMLKLCMSHIYHNKLKQQNLRDPASNESDTDRPRSCEVPGINIIATNACQMPQHETQTLVLGNNTGSLPDLSTLHFPSPLSVPIDHDDYPGHTTYESLHYAQRVDETYRGDPQTQSYGGVLPAYPYHQQHQPSYSGQDYSYVPNGSSMGISSPLLKASSALTASSPYTSDQTRSTSFVATPRLGNFVNFQGSQSNANIQAYYLDQNNNVQPYNQRSYYKDPSVPQESNSQLRNSYNAVDPNHPPNNLYPSYNSSFEDGLNKDPMMGFYDTDRNQKSMYTIDSYSRSLGQAYPSLDEAFKRSKEVTEGHNLSLSPSSRLDWDGPGANSSKYSPYHSYTGPDRNNSRRYHSTTIDPYQTSPLGDSQTAGLYLPHKSPLGNALSDDDQAAAAFGVPPSRRSRSQDNGRHFKKRPNNLPDPSKLSDSSQAPSLALANQQCSNPSFNSSGRLDYGNRWDIEHSHESTNSPSKVGYGGLGQTCQPHHQLSGSEVSSPYSVKSTQPPSPLNPLDPFHQYYQQQNGSAPGYPFKSSTSSSYTNISVSAFDALPLAELALGSGNVGEDYMTNHDPRTSPLTPGSDLGLLPDSDCCIGDLLMDTIVIGINDTNSNRDQSRVGGIGGQSSPTTNPTITLNGDALSDECSLTQLEANDEATLNVDEFLDTITSPTYAPSPPALSSINHGSFWPTPYGNPAGNAGPNPPNLVMSSLKNIPHIILTGADDKLMMSTSTGCNSMSDGSPSTTTLSSVPYNSIYEKTLYRSSNENVDMATTTQ